MLSFVKIILRHGYSLREDGADLAASKMDSNFDFSTDLVENALALHLLDINSFIGKSVFADFVIISLSGFAIDDLA
jgi:hypothetical protein